MNPETQRNPDPEAYNETYQHPLDQCDLIMKGGVTSGVVYPPAILELAKEYRFRSVGGTSAGAIAAAATAAAEYGREKQPDGLGPPGFAGLYELKKDLQTPEFLIGLFQTTWTTRPLLQTFLEGKDLVDASGRLRDAFKSIRRGRRQRSLTPGSTSTDQITLGEALTRVGLGVTISRRSRKEGRMRLPQTRVGFGALLAHALLSRSRRLSRRSRQRLTVAARIAQAGIAFELLWFTWAAHSLFFRRDKTLFGICTGMAGVSLVTRKTPALTPWLHRRLQQLAGLPLDDVLTIGKLRTKTLRDGKDEDVGIDFQMVTTNLSQRQPYTLHGEDLEDTLKPPLHPEELEAGYLFREEDMRRLFPEEVVKYLMEWTDPVKHPENADQWKRDRIAFEGFVIPSQGYFPFPRGNALPVLVATRMSLSFPLLLSAVRLYSIKYDTLERRRKEHWTKQIPHLLTVDSSREEDNDLKENWFSDGGIASNFPIHIFDAWLPTRRTFGINLADSQLPTALTGPRESPSHRPEDHDEDVFLAQPKEFFPPHVYPIHNAFGILGAIFDTAQNYRDNTQARMPSYRERVAQVRLKDNEGGLNLRMRPGTIKDVADKGARAARALEDKFDFDQHRWVRLLVLLARLEREFIRLREYYEKEAQRHGQKRTGNGQDKKPHDWRQEMIDRYTGLLDREYQEYNQQHPWYRAVDKADWNDWKTEALRRVDSLIGLIALWTTSDDSKAYSYKGQKYFFAYDEPIPEGILRVTPEH